MKALLLGWDAADWKIISPLMDAGEMPNLKRFVENGVAGNLSTLYPVLSPMLWTSIATGKRPWKHGIHGFIEPDAATGGVRPISSVGRTSKALWNIFNQEGLRSNVVSWWPSNPPEPINGVMVSDLFHKAKANSHDQWPVAPRDVHPTGLANTLHEFRVHPSEITAAEIVPFLAEGGEVEDTEDKRLFSLAKILAECSSVHALSTSVMVSSEWDFMAIYHDAIDHACHGFMKYHAPKLPWIPQKDFDLFNPVVNSMYKFHDIMLGQIMELAGPETTIFICSDHGFHADHMRPRELPNEAAGAAEEHRHFGMFAAMGPGIKKDELVFGASLLDITPTILHAYGLPVGRDMDGKVLTSIFEDQRPVEYIESWERVEGDSGGHPESVKVNVVDQHEALQQLVDLGYIDDVNENMADAAASAKRELKCNLSRDLIGANLHQKAIPIIEELWEEAQDEGRFGVLMFECRMALGQYSQAADALKLLRERKVTYAKEAAEQLEGMKEKLEAAKEKCEPLPEQEQRKVMRLRKKAGTRAAAFDFLEGRLTLAQKKPAEALPLFQSALKVQFANQQDVFVKLGLCHTQLDDFEKAEQAFAQALTLDPVNAEAHLGFARLYARQRRWSEVQESCQKALGLLYYTPSAHLLLGIALQKQGYALEAVAAYEVAVAQNPNLCQAHRRLAHILKTYPIDPVRAREHVKLALAARERVRAIKRGEMFSPADELEPVEAQKLATLGQIGSSDATPPALADDEVIIVSGLPRSGTSMMMQMLAAGGLTPLADEVREADVDNPRGYYEYEPSKARNNAGAWLADAEGKVVKVVAQLLPGITPNHRYRIVFMERPLNEILASQSKMLERNAKQGARIRKQALANQFVNQVGRVRDVLTARAEKVSVTSIHYHEALENPQQVAEALNTFLGGGLDVTAMVAAVAPELRRQGKLG